MSKAVLRPATLIDSVGLIGDVHAEDELLEHALLFLTSSGSSAIMCTGDVADGAGDVSRCCRLLVDHDVAVVRGNHDRWMVSTECRELPGATDFGTLDRDAADFIEALPLTVRFSTLNGEGLLCHGLGDNDMAGVKPWDTGYAIEVNEPLQSLVNRSSIRFVLCGHTHQRMVRSFGRVTIVNAGTLERDHSPGFLRVDFRSETVQFYRLDGRRGVQADGEVPLPVG